MPNVTRLAHVTLTTPDIARQVDYYESIVGLIAIEKTADRAVLATTLGVETLVLERAAAAGLARIGLQVAPGTDLAVARKQLQDRGIASELRQGVTPGVAHALIVPDNCGTPLEIFADYTFAAPVRRHVGIMPVKLGHTARFVPDVKGTETFYRDILGFRTSDWRTTVSVFLRCGPDHHTINVFRGDQTELAHIAFEVKDFSELQRACDVLAGHGMKLDWGPSRHNIGHNVACYHRCPDGLRIEVYTEMDQMKDEALGYFEPRPWHEDMPQRPKIWPASTSKNYWGLWGAS
jgi:catechol 2,3-dioxygenase-like lactoylglutathione lyase family enzyme